MRSNLLLIRECGLGHSHGTVIALLGSVLMHLLLEQWSETMSVPVDGPAAHTRFSARVALYTYDFALVFIETHTQTCLLCNLSVSPCEDRRMSGFTEVPNGSSVAPAVNAWLD